MHLLSTLPFRPLRKLWSPLERPFPSVAVNALQPLKNLHKDTKRCFVLGSGRSLGTLDLAPLRDEVVFGCNLFNLHPQASFVSPRYYGIQDGELFLKKRIHRAPDFDVPSLVNCLCREFPRTEFLLPLEAKDEIQKNGWFSPVKVWYVPQDKQKKQDFFDIETGAPRRFGVLVDFVIPLAMFMGFKQIFLLGVDCDVHALPASSYPHFYSKNPFTIPPDVQPRPTLEERLDSAHRQMYGFRLLDEAAVNRGVQIFNASSAGLLEIFPRVDLATILKH